MPAIDMPVSPDGSRLLIGGNDNHGKPRQEFADQLAAAGEGQYLELAERYIWLSAYAGNNPRSDYHWQCDAAWAEAKRRGKPGLFERAHRHASGSE